MDEASFKRGQDYNTVISAPELGRAIELARGRDGKGLEAWAGGLPEEVRAGVEVFCADLPPGGGGGLPERAPGGG